MDASSGGSISGPNIPRCSSTFGLGTLIYLILAPGFGPRRICRPRQRRDWMTYATVMVSLALDQANEARLEAAGEIAERFESGIVGIASAQFSPPLYYSLGEQAQNLIDQGEAAIKKRMSELEVQFREATKNRAKHVEWRCAIDFPARYILQEARCADIIVSGGQSNAFSDPFALASPKDLVMQAGRPLFIAPDNVSWLDLRSVLVAWKDTPEARRAIAHSLRPCRGSGMLWRGCHVTAFPPPSS